MSNFVWYLPVVLRIYIESSTRNLLPEDLTRMLDLMKYENVDITTVHPTLSSN